MIRGRGISSVTGLAGPTNGDVLRQGTFDLGNGPYVARAFIRYTIPLMGEKRDTLQRGMDQLAGVVSKHRIEITAGKFAASDLFDLNRYANTTRQQFMNWNLFQNTAARTWRSPRAHSNSSCHWHNRALPRVYEPRAHGKLRRGVDDRPCDRVNPQYLCGR